MQLNELTNTYTKKDTDIGLMTREEFARFRNPHDKFHDTTSYEASISNLNYASYEAHVVHARDMEGVLYVYDDGSIYVNNDHGVKTVTAAIYGDVLYHSIKFNKSVIPYLRQWISVSETKSVKYLKPMVDDIKGYKKRNLSKYGILINHLKGDLEIRTERSPYNSGDTIVILNKEGMIVAMASDEWGATLLRVATEFRGAGLGPLLGKVWYEYNPTYQSGGYTAAGSRNSLNMWGNRVRELLASGVYTHLISTGEISKEKVNKILSGLPDRAKKKDLASAENYEKKLLIYTDLDSMIILYDARFLEDQDEKYVYAHAFVRDFHSGMYIYTLDYVPEVRKLATVAIFQLAKNNDYPITVTSPPSDHLDLEGITIIKVDNGIGYLENDVIDLPAISKIESLYRKKFDKYDEIRYSLLEIANSKFDE